MRSATRLSVFSAGLATTLFAAGAFAQDWPQWRGLNRDAKVVGFKAPDAWPKELKREWKVPVGNGVATPALVGDRLYVFAMEDRNEILRCLEAATGKEVWARPMVEGHMGRLNGKESTPTGDPKAPSWPADPNRDTGKVEAWSHGGGAPRPRIRRSATAGAFLDGVNAASLALMAVVTWQLGRAALVDPATVTLALVGGAVLFRFRPNSAWLVLAGGLIGLLRAALGGS